jgi:hypothetical protein
VEVDPADVVSVPVDYEAQKMRVCKYKVIAQSEAPIQDILVNRNPEIDTDEDSEDDCGDDIEYCERCDEEVDYCECEWCTACDHFIDDCTCECE